MSGAASGGEGGRGGVRGGGVRGGEAGLEWEARVGGQALKTHNSIKIDAYLMATLVLQARV